MHAADQIRWYAGRTSYAAPGRNAPPALEVAILGHLAVVHDSAHRIAAVAVVSPAGDCAAVSRAGDPW